LLLAICVSIRPSVTLVIRAQTVQNIEISFALSDRAMLDACFLVWHLQCSCLLLIRWRKQEFSER